MIEKMQFLSITGPKDDIDRVVAKYLSKYEIQLENALSQLKNVADLRPYIAINPYKDAYQRSQELLCLADASGASVNENMTLEEASQCIDEVSSQCASINAEIQKKKEEQERLQASLDKITPFEGLNLDVSTIMKFKAIKFRFGRISRDYFKSFEKYVYDSVETFFYQCRIDENYVWGVCFVPATEVARIDAIYKSMHFERIYLPDEYEGTASEAVAKLNAAIEEIKSQIRLLTEQRQAIVQKRIAEIVSANHVLGILNQNFNVRKLAACTENQETFYILCGWMAKKDADRFRREIESDSNVYCIVEEDQNDLLNPPPTKLKNPKIFQPFEMFIRMYGLPAYNEFDPTVFVALTYAFFFGWMFGDVGQGLLLAIGGFALYRVKKMDLAAIIGFAGIFSTVFGFLFGSIFGFEDVLPALWMRPISAMSDVPFMGRLNTVFLISVAVGIGMILLTMVIHIVNAIREKDRKAALFDTNGVAGLVFYASVTTTIALFMAGKKGPGIILILILFVIPLILIAFKDQVARVLLKEKEEEKNGPVMTVVQALFELIEVLLSYFSNTLSFVRVGAFAVSHAAMMEVVLMLAGAESGSPNWVVVVLGNLFVCGMEGLVVGIQVLRLEYYELFSRFYKGNGRAFQPYGSGNPSSN